MVNIKMWRHPKYYKELRKRNRSFLLRKEECTLGKLGNRRLEETSSDKPQAASSEPQATSAKRQAPSVKLQADIKNPE